MRAFKLTLLSKCLLILALGTGLSYAITPFYQNYMLKKHMAAMRPEMDALLAHITTYANIYGHFPNKTQLNLDMPRYAYDLTTWIPTPQTYVLQGGLNGPVLGLDPGYGGMITCLLANRAGSIHTKCFYQVKHM